MYSTRPFLGGDQTLGWALLQEILFHLHKGSIKQALSQPFSGKQSSVSLITCLGQVAQEQLHWAALCSPHHLRSLSRKKRKRRNNTVTLPGWYILQKFTEERDLYCDFCDHNSLLLRSECAQMGPKTPWTELTLHGMKSTGSRRDGPECGSQSCFPMPTLLYLTNLWTGGSCDTHSKAYESCHPNHVYNCKYNIWSHSSKVKWEI